MSLLQTALGAMPTGTIVDFRLYNSTKLFNKLIDEQIKKEALTLHGDKNEPKH